MSGQSDLSQSELPAIAKPTVRARDVRGSGRFTARNLQILGGLILLPAVVIAFKLSGVPKLEAIFGWLSFEQLPMAMRSRTLHLLFAPVGALVVVFFRLTLGIRVLGPFRSVLLAIAFQVTGAVVGMVFFGLVVGFVYLLRPMLKSMRLPFFGRASAMLASVAGLIVLAVLVGLALGFPSVERVAYFPVVVLTLTGDAFATAVRREGTRLAIWRATVTAGVALLITALSSIEALQDVLIRFPELLLIVLAGVIGVSVFMNLRLFQHLNPAPVRKKKKSAKAKPTGAAEPIAMGNAPTEP